MRCPICKTNVNELAEECPNCKTNFDEFYEHRRNNDVQKKRTNVDGLNIMANINIVISTIIAIFVCCTSLCVEVGNLYYNKSILNVDWSGIISGIAILLAGFTLFFLLKTVVDIYRKVEK